MEELEQSNKYYTPKLEEFRIGFEYYLYRHLKADSGEPFYIGIGKKHNHSNTIESEYKRAYSKKRSNFWHKIVNKHGVNIEILFESNSKNEIVEKEIEFIKLYGRRDLNTGILCNMTDGGEFPSNINREKEAIRRNKISEALKKRKRNQATFNKISQSKLKPIYKCDLHMNIIEEFNSVSEAALNVGLTISSISKCLKNNNYTAGGYRWKIK